MSSKITYENKGALKNDLDVPDKNKVTEDDMNEIKNVVNANADELDTAKENIGDLQSGQGTASADITNLKNKVATLESDNTTNKSNISNLQSNKVDKIEGKGLSTNDFTNEYKEKLDDLENYDDTEVKKDISDIKEEQVEQNTNTDLVADMIPTLESEEAENINVDSSKYYGQVKVRGKSEQETRSGKNFFDVSKDLTSANTDYEYTHLDNGYRIKLTQATSGARYMVYSGQIHLEPGQYIFSCLLTVSGGTKSNRGRVRIYNSSGSIIYPVASDIDCNNELKYASFNIEEATDITIAFYYVSNSTIEITENANIYCEWKNIQLEKSNQTQPTEYEDYGASPSSEYPSEMENLSGDIEITVCNKNFFNKNTAKQDYILSATGQEVASSGAFISDYILVKKGISYFSNTRGYSNAGFYDLDKNFIERKDLNQNVTLLFEEDCYIRLNGKTENINTFQFEIGTFATDYIEHEEQEITFPLSQGQKMYDGDYLADDGIHHVRKQIELDGTESWNILNWSTPHTKTTIFYSEALIAKRNNSIRLCNYFKRVENTAENLDKDEEYCLSAVTGAIYICISNEIATTGEQLNTWLAQKKQEGKPLIAEYTLIEEEIDPYTEAQQEAYDKLNEIMTYYPVTNVYSNQGAKLQLIYKMNLNSMFATVQKAIVEGGN